MITATDVRALWQSLADGGMPDATDAEWHMILHDATEESGERLLEWRQTGHHWLVAVGDEDTVNAAVAGVDREVGAAGYKSYNVFLRPRCYERAETDYYTGSVEDGKHEAELALIRCVRVGTVKVTW